LAFNPLTDKHFLIHASVMLRAKETSSQVCFMVTLENSQAKITLNKLINCRKNPLPLGRGFFRSCFAWQILWGCISV